MLIRSSPRITLTREGLDFCAEPERLLVAVSRLEAQARDIASGAPRSFDAAAISAVGLSVIPRALARLDRSKLRGAVRLSIQSAQSVPFMLTSGQADIVFFNPPLQGIAIRPLAEEIMFTWSVIVSDGHPQRGALGELVTAHEQVVAETIPGFRRLDQTELRILLSAERK
ncbi:LysR family transcriptional regulator [Aliiruegeria lutimaris]|uniref:Uncharacterized protein n=1 Tax=Aliiruegeria lutimaris TaxID=571298 RepID=A0A1G9I4K3_9RHOB|nr:LysR family transcriptional regulator [Aliiruegeria lutimaris]SDL19743.1 hypothetical protein SAMN04488026_10729 [Aliiruegeria lutimaris]